jgi:transposase InsO family protein
VTAKRRQKRTGESDLPTTTKAGAPGDVGAIDFQLHATVAGKPLKILSIVDEHTKETLGGQVGCSITASDLTDELDVLEIERGSPRILRIDNGPEFRSRALRVWALEVDLAFIPPGYPWRNGFIESFNSRVWDECLSVNQVSLSQLCERPDRDMEGGIQPDRATLIAAIFGPSGLC